MNRFQAYPPVIGFVAAAGHTYKQYALILQKQPVLLLYAACRLGSMRSLQTYLSHPPGKADETTALKRQTTHLGNASFNNNEGPFEGGRALQMASTRLKQLPQRNEDNMEMNGRQILCKTPGRALLFTSIAYQQRSTAYLQEQLTSGPMTIPKAAAASKLTSSN